MMNSEHKNIPTHLAIIMDGNGRWAKNLGKQRVFGHREGVKRVQEIVETAQREGIQYLTLYTFSTENWNRPKEEVSVLMRLLVRSLKTELNKMLKNGVRLNTIGNQDRLPEEVKEMLGECVEKTKNNDRLVLTLALNYGGKEELTQMVQQIGLKVKNNIISPENVDETIINKHLYTQNLPEVDLLIRTGGEHRISNFLLWQIAYAELYFTPTYWPEFDTDALKEAIANYQNRERRFGKTSEQLIP